LLTLAATGCSQPEKEEVIVVPPPVKEVVEVAEPEPELMHIGDGPNAFEAVNATGMTITQIQFKLPDSEDFNEDEALSDIEIPDGEHFILSPNFLTGDEDMDEVNSFDVLLTFDYEDSELDILVGYFPLDDFSDLRFMFEDDIAFVEYHDDTSSESVSTKENEVERLAAVAAAEEERLAAEAAAAAPAPRRNAPAPRAAAPARAPAPDICVEEPVLRY